MQTRRIAGTLAACGCLFLIAAGVQAAQEPNIVLILADDLGNADLGYRASQIRTPSLDSLAKGIFYNNLRYKIDKNR